MKRKKKFSLINNATNSNYLLNEKISKNDINFNISQRSMENTFIYTNHKMRKAVLRFLHLYGISYIYLFMLTSQFSPLEGTYKNGVLWGCKNIFNYKQVEYIKITGSGDTTLDYCVVIANLIFASVVVLIVILTDKKQRTFKDLHWL